LIIQENEDEEEEEQYEEQEEQTIPSTIFEKTFA
jgi:hypothetical protein